MRPRAPWLLYALGGGLGHATRALALARAAARRGHPVHLLINTPRLPAEALEAPGLTVERVAADEGRAGVEQVLARLRAGPPFAAWVVDTFPRGLVGELAPLLKDLPEATVWIHRDLTPAYAGRPEVLAAARAYALALVPGDGERAPLAEPVGARRTPPWLIRDRAELLSPEAARRRLGVREGQRAVVVSGAGTEAEAAESVGLAARLQVALGDRADVRAVSPDGAAGTLRCWPLLELLPGVDLLVGAGGYHTVYEARATATPLVALPRARLYDRQAERLRPEERAADEEDVVRRVAALLEAAGERPRPAAPDYANGAHEAVRAIEALLPPA